MSVWFVDFAKLFSNKFVSVVEAKNNMRWVNSKCEIIGEPRHGSVCPSGGNDLSGLRPNFEVMRIASLRNVTRGNRRPNFFVNVVLLPASESRVKLEHGTRNI